MDKIRKLEIKNNLLNPLWKSNPKKAYEQLYDEITELKAHIYNLKTNLEFYSYRTTINRLNIEHELLSILLGES